MSEGIGMEGNKLMHGLLSGGVVRLMASDTKKASPEAKKIEISLSVDDKAKLRKIFEILSDCSRSI